VLDLPPDVRPRGPARARRRPRPRLPDRGRTAGRGPSCGCAASTSSSSRWCWSPPSRCAALERPFLAGMAAVADGISAHAPPEKAVTFDWPDAIRFDGARLGGARLAWPEGIGEDDAPDWLVFSAILSRPRRRGGLTPGSTFLEAEGYRTGPKRQGVEESFLPAPDAACCTFTPGPERGIGPVADGYSRPPSPRPAGVRSAGLSRQRHLLLPGPHPNLKRRPLAAGLLAPSWLDRARGAAAVIKLPPRMRLDPSDLFVFEWRPSPRVGALRLFPFWTRPQGLCGQAPCRLPIRLCRRDHARLSHTWSASPRRARRSGTSRGDARGSHPRPFRRADPGSRARGCAGGDRRRGFALRPSGRDHPRPSPHGGMRRHPRAFSHPPPTRARRGREPTGCTAHCPRLEIVERTKTMRRKSGSTSPPPFTPEIRR
jgi:hypothetical protein